MSAKDAETPRRQENQEKREKEYEAKGFNYLGDCSTGLIFQSLFSLSSWRLGSLGAHAFFALDLHCFACLKYLPDRVEKPDSFFSLLTPFWALK